MHMMPLSEGLSYSSPDCYCTLLYSPEVSLKAAFTFCHIRQIIQLCKQVLQLKYFYDFSLKK